MRNCVKIEIFLRNLLHKWEMAIFLAQGAAVYNYKAKKLRTQDDAFGKIVALPPSSLLCFVTLCLFTRSKMSTLYSSQATQKTVEFWGECQKDKENTDAVDWSPNSLRQAFLKGGYGTQVWVTHFA